MAENHGSAIADDTDGRRAHPPRPSTRSRLERLHGLLRKDVVLSHGLVVEVDSTRAMFDYTLTPEHLACTDPDGAEVRRVDLRSVEEFMLPPQPGGSPVSRLWVHAPAYELAVALLAAPLVAAPEQPGPRHLDVLVTYLLLKHGARR